jgi:hypothetical protein
VDARRQRTLRGTAAASVATLVSATAHTLAGGGAGSPLLLAAVVVLASPVAIALVGRRSSVPRLALAATVSQILFHAAFAITFPVAGSQPPPTLSHVHAPQLTQSASVSVAHHAALIPDAPMLAAHAIAAVITVALLARGERMVRTIARGIRELVERHVSLVPLVVVAVPRPRGIENVAAVLRRFAADISRRGPPLVSLSH